jgi:hypothetical protein
VETFRTRAEASGALKAKQRFHLQQQFEQTLQSRLMATVRARALPVAESERLIDRMSARELDPFSAADSVLQKMGLA